MAIDYTKVPSPCYVLNEGLLRKNLELIRSVKERAGVEIILAFKGFAMWSTFPIVREYITGATASSVYEARLAFEEMKTEAHTYCPAYSEKDFDQIIRYSSHITFNSLTQAERFLPLVKQSGKNISVGLRINPEFSEVETDLYNPCAPGSRLGVMVDKLNGELPEGIDGLHVHALCESSAKSTEKLLEAVEAKFGDLLSKLKWLNLGGGHLMTRKGYDVEHLIHVLTSFRAKYPNLQLILEPGSAFAWETGDLVSTVLDIVKNKGVTTAILDVSFTAHMPDCLEMPYKPVIVGAIDEVEGLPTYRIGGDSCLAGDYIGNWSFKNELVIGELIIFADMIHYTMVKTTMFNGVDHPSIGIWNDEKGFQLVRKFSFDDYKYRLS